MPRNIEIKARVSDMGTLTTKVADMADQGPIELVQDDTFFTCNAGRLKLRALSIDEGELIFHSRAKQPGPKESF